MYDDDYATWGRLSFTLSSETRADASFQYWFTVEDISIDTRQLKLRGADLIAYDTLEAAS